MNKLANHTKSLAQNYLRRKYRTNVTIKSHLADFRLIVNRSNKFTYGQVIDRVGKVICSANDFKLTGTKTQRATQVGHTLWSHLSTQKITHVVFDRNGYLYHGRIKALCDAVRESGIQI